MKSDWLYNQTSKNSFISAYLYLSKFPEVNTTLANYSLNYFDYSIVISFYTISFILIILLLCSVRKYNAYTSF